MTTGNIQDIEPSHAKADFSYGIVVKTAVVGPAVNHQCPDPVKKVCVVDSD
jgi:hypothetical protein